MKIFEERKGNVLTDFLYLSNVKFTEQFANKLFNEHPHKYDLYGLSKMLSVYNIENKGVKILDKNTDLPKLETPFIAYADEDFIVVQSVKPNEVIFLKNGKKEKNPLEDFCETWTGEIIYADINENSIEPDYQKNKLKDIISRLSKLMFLSIIISFIIFLYIKNQSYTRLEINMLIIINIIGTYIGYLLIIKQMNLYHSKAEMICKMFKQKSNCNNVLNSDAAKIGGIIGWSEVGFGYFIINVLVLTCFPSLVSYLILLNIATLPYSVWSIWYQKYEVKQWCPLCIIVQLLLWCIFIIGLIFKLITVSKINIVYIYFLCSLYCLAVLSINLIIHLINSDSQLKYLIQKFNMIKAEEDILPTLLNKQPYYKVNLETSSILWGNREANMLVTVLTNPHCHACANLHLQLEKILKLNTNLCFQYIFIAYSSFVESSNKFLVAAYQFKNEEEKFLIFKKWFENGRLNKNIFIDSFNLNLSDPDVLHEFNKHKHWIKTTGLTETPTILLNGYKLPEYYNIEDLIYL